MKYKLFFTLNQNEPELQGTFDTIEEAEKHMQLLIDTKSRIKLWYICKSIRAKSTVYDYGAHNAFYEIKEVTEELGVLQVQMPDRDSYDYFLRDEFSYWDLTRMPTLAYECTRKEAEQFPQFKWIALSELK